MIELINLTTITMTYQSTYDDNKDIIWPTIVGIFVALALGWMACRYKCSTKERSPHLVQCCPESLCQRIRLCCIALFSLCRFKNELQQQQEQQPTSPNSLILRNKRRSSNHSILEIPFIINNFHSSTTLTNQSWSSTNHTQGPISPLLSPTMYSSQPKIHPLRRESNGNERRDSSPWPFPVINMVFHKETNEIKKNSIFFNA